MRYLDRQIQRARVVVGRAGEGSIWRWMIVIDVELQLFSTPLDCILKMKTAVNYAIATLSELKENVTLTYNLSTGRWRVKDQEFKASLGYTVR